MMSNQEMPLLGGIDILHRCVAYRNCDVHFKTQLPMHTSRVLLHPSHAACTLFQPKRQENLKLIFEMFSLLQSHHSNGSLSLFLQNFRLQRFYKMLCAMHHTTPHRITSHCISLHRFTLLCRRWHMHALFQ